MEERNKPEAGGETKKKDHHPRRHGYFIQPPAPKGAQGDAASKPASPKINEVTAEGGERKAQGGERGAKPHHKHHRGGKHHNNKGASRPEAQNNAPDTAKEQVAREPAEQTAEREVRQDNAHRGDHKKNKNRNKNNHRPTQNNEEKREQTPEKESAPKAQNERNERPERRDKRKSAADVLTIPRPTPVHTSDEYEEYKLVPDTDESAAQGEQAEAAEVEKTEVVGVRFKSTGKVYYFDPAGATYPKGTSAIVDTARGQEFGEVAMSNAFVSSSDIVPPLRQVVRAATEADIAHHKENKAKEQEAFKICSEKILVHKLDMKLIEAQYTFDNSKLLFYFTSSDRVDFRNLVKDLASVFRTRIELRQIGIRDEAKLVGGLGMCGRPLCCTLFLSDFDQVSIKMAKEQNLSLNSAKISGICGRLMCCLKYEHEAYEYEIKRTPPVDSLVRTENGDGVVTETNPLRGLIKVRLLASPEVPPKTYHRDDVTMLRKKQNKEQKDN